MFRVLEREKRIERRGRRQQGESGWIGDWLLVLAFDLVGKMRSDIMLEQSLLEALVE